MLVRGNFRTSRASGPYPRGVRKQYRSKFWLQLSRASVVDPFLHWCCIRPLVTAACSEVGAKPGYRRFLCPKNGRACLQCLDLYHCSPLASAVKGSRKLGIDGSDNANFNTLIWIMPPCALPDVLEQGLSYSLKRNSRDEFVASSPNFRLTFECMITKWTHASDLAQGGSSSYVTCVNAR